MFLDKYLNQIYIDLVYDNYDEEYLKTLNEDNFNEVYKLLKNNGFYFIDDIILNYLELFELNVDSLEHAIYTIRKVLGNDYVKKIGNNMIFINKIIEMAINYEKY